MCSNGNRLPPEPVPINSIVPLHSQELHFISMHSSVHLSASRELNVQNIKFNQNSISHRETLRRLPSLATLACIGCWGSRVGLDTEDLIRNYSLKRNIIAI